LGAGENLHEEWRARLVTLGRHVRAQTPSGTEEGLAEDFDPDGALLLRRADGSLMRLLAGDVTLST
jgi:BirA family biotin operon repressor/biotin-[acetyl-CoA-carboxylase] ligase